MTDSNELGSTVLVRYALIHDKDSENALNVEFLAQAWCLRDRIRLALVKNESPRIIGLRFDSIRLAGCGCQEHLWSILVAIKLDAEETEPTEEAKKEIADTIMGTSLNAGASDQETLAKQGFLLTETPADEPVVGPCEACPTGSVCEQLPDGTFGPPVWPTEGFYG